MQIQKEIHKTGNGDPVEGARVATTQSNTARDVWNPEWKNFALFSHIALLTVTMTLAQIVSRAPHPSIEGVVQLLAEGLGGALLPLIAGWLSFRKSKRPAGMFAWSWGLMALFLVGMFSR